MMKKLFLAVVGLFAVVGLSAQDIKSDNLQDFSTVELTGKINVTLEESDHNAIEVSLVNSDLSRLQWGIKDGKLSIRLKPSSMTGAAGSADIKILYKSLSKIEGVSGANIRSVGPVKTGMLTVHASSGTNISLETYVSDLTVNSEGNSVVLLKGSANYMTVKCTTKGKLDARDLEAKSAIVVAQLNSEVFVWGTDKLDARAVTNSVIYYRGTPEILKISEKMMGSVEQFSF